MTDSFHLLLHGEILGEEYNHHLYTASVNRILLKSWISHNSDLDLPDLSQSCIYLEKPSFYQIFQRLLLIWRNPVSSRFLSDLYYSGGTQLLANFSHICIYLEELTFFQISHRLAFIWMSPFGADPKHSRWRRS